MKRLKQILVAMLVVASVVSCKKDGNETNRSLEKETLSAKWVVDGTSDYKSFEFNESGSYIVVKNSPEKSTDNQMVLFGTYEIVDNETIVLSDFGTMKVTELNDDSIGFSIQLTGNPNSDVIIMAAKQAEMKSSKKTDLLCRTWKLVTDNDENVAGTDQELTVLFSAAGTYYVSFANPSDDNEDGLAQWKWTDETESTFFYSWSDVPVWSEESKVEIIELTKNVLKILEKYDDGDENLYELEPMLNAKSANANPTKTQNAKSLKNGFLKR